MNGLKKLFVGTVARGIMWAAGALAAKYGCETISESTAEGVAAFLVALGFAAAAAIWSNRKDKKLIES